jgi:undecaprenyl-diphosphatase
LVGLDRHLDRWVVHHRTEPFDTIFVWLSRAGSTGLVWVVISIVVAIVWRRYALFGMTLLTVLVADTSNYVLKDVFDRPRPSTRYAEPEPLMQPPPTHSLPSGHATTSFACATVIAASMPRLRVPLYVLAALVAWSRVYVGVHYPLDVLAGALYGLAVGLLLVRALPRLAELLLRSLRARRQG